MTELFRYEFTVTPGLENLAERELAATPWGSQAQIQSATGLLAAASAEPYPPEQVLRTAVALYEVLDFPVPRPKALLGHQHLTRIIHACKAILSPSFTTLSISAAGKSSEVMQRLLAELAAALQLKAVRDVGDLHLRIRRSTLHDDGWAVLVRRTPRPWATRAWRSENLPGSLHAPVAAAMAMLAQPTETVLNVGSGSGTIAIETSLIHPNLPVVSLDVDWANIQLTRRHMQAAAVGVDHLLQADARTLPLADASFGAVLSDLPFGQLMGHNEDLQALYTAWLRETARVTQLEGRGVFLTHAVRLMMEVLGSVQDVWQVEKILPITLNGLHPRLFMLKRRNGR
jgi:23S rRNA G2445 N2-methylase RlmL